MLNVYYTLSKQRNKKHPENQDRIDVSIEYLKKNLPQNINIFSNKDSLKHLQETFSTAPINKAKLLLTQVYSNDYLDGIESICDELENDDIKEGDTYFSTITYKEVVNNSYILYDVCYQIVEEFAKYAYCLIRPPSHHAKLNKYNGFCIVNHTFVIAKYLNINHDKRICILDYDVHHGDGTQELVKAHTKDDVYFCSMHCFAPGFFPGTGGEEENSERILNVPFEKHTKDDEYIKKFDSVVCPFIQKANPDIIIISNGLYEHVDDTFKVMYLTSKFYIHVTKYLKSLDRSLIYILEGGYNPEVIGNISKDIITTIVT